MCCAAAVRACRACACAAGARQQRACSSAAPARCRALPPAQHPDAPLPGAASAAAMGDEVEDDAPAGLFAEPEGYFQEHRGSEVVYERGVVKPGQPRSLTLQLAPKHSLWGHCVWNAARLLAQGMDIGELPVAGCAVLELGAGAGLPSLSAALAGAAAVVVTDYGTAADDTLMVPLRANADALRAARPAGDAWCDVDAEPHVWGTDVAPLLARLARLGAPDRRFDRILLADLLFNRQSHRQLLTTCKACLAPGGRVWVTYSHHDPGKAALDNAFWALAPEHGFKVRKLREVQFERDLFVEGDGLDQARAVVHFYELTHAGEDADG